MIKKSYIPLLFMLISVSAIILHAQETKSPDEKVLLLKEIAENINNYKAKTITMQLKLKHLDRIFEKIIFYDKKNHDIEFDISSKITRKRLSSDMLNLHEGLDYFVTFTIQKVGNLGEVMGDLLGFKPVFLDSVPVSNEKK